MLRQLSTRSPEQDLRDIKILHVPGDGMYFMGDHSQ
jgi:hypothetical protein